MTCILVLAPEDEDLASEIEAALAAADPGTDIVVRQVPYAGLPPSARRTGPWRIWR